MARSSHIETLFTNQNPISYGYRTQAEDDFSYMNSHADSPVLAVRNLLEDWFQSYPTDSRNDLARRFRSDRLSQHQGAFWELYLHELFRSMGFAVITHSPLSGRTTRPDLLLLRDGAPLAYVEARLAGSPSDAEASARRLKAELQDALNQVSSPNFFLMIEELENAPKRPSFKSLQMKVEAWLSLLDPDDSSFREYGPCENRSQFEWSQDGWFLRLHARPRSIQSRGKAGIRSLGSTGFEARWLDSKGEIRSALKDKAGKYGDLTLPFVIAVNYMGMHCDRSDWYEALYGSEAADVCARKDGTYLTRSIRRDDGFWVRHGGAHHQEVSAVLGGWHISPWTMGVHLVEVYDHFSPLLALGDEVDLPRWSVPAGKQKLELREGRSAAGILKLPNEWPGKWEHS